MNQHSGEERRAQLTAAFAQLTPQEQNSALAILKTLSFAQAAQEENGEVQEKRPDAGKGRTDDIFGLKIGMAYIIINRKECPKNDRKERS